MRKFKSLQEARKHRYGAWVGNKAGTPYREGGCVEEVAERGRAINFYQCPRKATVGMYCKQHDPAAVSKRRKESYARFKKELDNSPPVLADRYRKALKRIANMPAVCAWDASAMAEVARKALK